MPDITLEDLMETVHGAALDIASTGELRSPLLIYARPGGVVCGLALTVPGVHPADIARIALASEGATMAALCMESWKVEVETTPEMKSELDAGRIPNPGFQPRHHPDRYDALVLIGEVRGKPQVQRHWRIHPGPPRTFEKQEIGSGDWMRGRFTPLFISEREAAELAYGQMERHRLSAQAEQDTN